VRGRREREKDRGKEKWEKEVEWRKWEEKGGVCPSLQKSLWAPLGTSNSSLQANDQGTWYLVFKKIQLSATVANSGISKEMGIWKTLGDV